MFIERDMMESLDTSMTAWRSELITIDKHNIQHEYNKVHLKGGHGLSFEEFQQFRRRLGNLLGRHVRYREAVILAYRCFVGNNNDKEINLNEDTKENTQ